MNRDIVRLRPLDSPPPHLLLSTVDGKVHQPISPQFHSAVYRINRRQQLPPTRPLGPLIPRRKPQAVLRPPREAARFDLTVAEVQNDILHDAVGLMEQSRDDGSCDGGGLVVAHVGAGEWKAPWSVEVLVYTGVEGAWDRGSWLVVGGSRVRGPYPMAGVGGVEASGQVISL